MDATRWSTRNGGGAHDGCWGWEAPLPSKADRAVERRLREELREEVGRALSGVALLLPTPEDEERVRRLIRERIARHQHDAANRNEPLITDPEGLAERLFDRLLGLGPLEILVRDHRVEEILVDGPGRVFVVVAGRRRLVPHVFFEDDAEVRGLVKRAAARAGRRLDEAWPMADLRLPDGSRLNVVIPPVSEWTVLCLRKFLLKGRTLAELVDCRMLTEELARFLAAAVQGGVPLVVSGQTAVGKSTVLNALGACLAPVENGRTITIEETRELALDKILPDCVALQARPANLEGAGEIRIRDLVRNALRMRPDVIVVGEVRGGESWDMLQALNTGHSGCMSTVHANSPRDALERLADLAMMAEERPSAEVATRMVARAIELVVQLRFDRDGVRRVASVFEVTGLEGSTIAGNELWTHDPESDRLVWTGIRPRCLARIAARGIPYALPSAAGVRP